MAQATATHLLELQHVSRAFGGLKAVADVNLYLDKGELVGLIGPNGAGKTTIFNLLTGVYEPSSGEIRFADQSIGGMKPYQITRRGIARTFQNIRLFPDLTVLENVQIACHWHARHSVLSSILRLPSHFRGERKIMEQAIEMLRIFKLEGKREELAKNLPYGEQRRLEIARALATKPRLLLLDEPAAGMNPQETQELMHLIRWLREQFSLTILLIEHDMNLVMGVCERIYVLDYGRIIAEGNPETIRRHPKVIEAYLGQEVS